MAEEDGENGVKKALEQCAMVQSMIDISTEHLDGLRTQCATSAELTQQEIRTLEGKLIKLFSRQLLAKTFIRESEQLNELEQYPKLKQWLVVVGLSKPSVQALCQRVKSLEEMLTMTDRDIKQLLPYNSSSKSEEERRLIAALQNLRKYTECLRQGQKALGNELDLHWDSWDQGLSNSGGTSPRPPRLRSARSSVPSEEILKSNPSSPPVNVIPSSTPWSPNNVTTSVASNFIPPPTAQVVRDKKYTPPPTPPTSNKKSEKIKFHRTPPPRKRHQTAVANLLPDSYPLTKSKSHESQLANRVDVPDSNPRYELHPRQRFLTEPGLESDQDDLGMFPSPSHSSSLTNSPMRASPNLYSEPHGRIEESNSRSPINAPTSPRTPTLVPQLVPPNTNVQHRLNVVLKMTNCDFCKRQMFIGLKCRGCKARCHRDCVDRLPASCSLVKMLNDGTHSPNMSRHIISPPSHKKDKSEHRRHGGQPSINLPFQGGETCSNTSSSSCNSSTPSSPAPNCITHTPPPLITGHFVFADVPVEKDVTLETRPLIETSEMVEMQKSNDSDKTMSGTSGSTDSEKTLAGRVDSQDSQVSDVDSVDRPWPRQNSLSFREWEIPYSELTLGEIVGSGRFGTVWKGNWHGEVAIKVFNMDQMDDENIIDAFKQEVATFRKTRHENLVLFMCACMKPPHLAIVTRLCKGMTLHTHIHLRRDRFNLNRAIIIAQQIFQGMGYLHARGIVHKDLKTKNIFLENGKVVITDFGLFSITKLCHRNRKGDWLTIPPGWLCYLAPEIICCLRASNDFRANDIPFTKASDVYAFGTVWYELLCGEWPFKGQPPEAIIWQVGKGMKQSLSNIQASKDVKDILMLCWSYKASDRPEFSQILKLLEKLPKKRLARSPSHPIHLSRSAESVF